MDFVEICKVCARKAIIEAAKRIINSDKVCHSYIDFNFGVTFLEHSVYSTTMTYLTSKAIDFGEKRKIRAITPFKVIQGRYQWKARMRLPTVLS